MEPVLAVATMRSTMLPASESSANISMLTRPAFWSSYAIILPFQLLTNWWLTSRNIVMYSPDAIIGIRICSAPIEDLLFGFALVLSVMGMWEFWGRRGVQRY